MQLERQVTIFRELLRANTQSPSPIKTTLNQLIKGCKIAFSGRALLAQENQYLQTIIKELQQKKKRSYCQIIYSEGFSIEKAHNFIQHKNKAQEA